MFDALENIIAQCLQHVPLKDQNEQHIIGSGTITRYTYAGFIDLLQIALVYYSFWVRLLISVYYLVHALSF